MWCWLFDRIRRKESRFVASDCGGIDRVSATTVLYAKVNPGLLSEGSQQDSLNQGPDSEQPVSISGDCVAQLPTAMPDLKNPDPVRAARVKTRRQRVLQFARQFGEMTPSEARLLFAIHRRTVRGLAKESPVALQRDLRRFILSTRGQRISCGKPAPSLPQIRNWIETARQHDCCW